MTPAEKSAPSKVRLAIMTVTPAVLALLFLSAWQLQQYTKAVRQARADALAQATSQERESYQLLEQCWILNGVTRSDSAAENERCLSAMDPEQRRRAQRLNQDIDLKIHNVPVPLGVRLLGGAP